MHGATRPGHSTQTQTDQIGAHSFGKHCDTHTTTTTTRIHYREGKSSTQWSFMAARRKRSYPKMFSSVSAREIPESVPSFISPSDPLAPEREAGCLWRMNDRVAEKKTGMCRPRPCYERLGFSSWWIMITDLPST